jgi:predicted aconitase with swiveling domain
MNTQIAKAEVVVKGIGSGEVLRVSPPLSFWGGIDPATGKITDPRHPQHGVSIAGRAMVMERVVGSSSGSSIVLELIAANKAPSLLILSETDCIASLGVVVANAMDYAGFPVLQMTQEACAGLPEHVRVDETGTVYAG